MSFRLNKGRFASSRFASGRFASGRFASSSPLFRLANQFYGFAFLDFSRFFTNTERFSIYFINSSGTFLLSHLYI